MASEMAFFFLISISFFASSQLSALESKLYYAFLRLCDVLQFQLLVNALAAVFHVYYCGYPLKQVSYFFYLIALSI